jgi:hypothetical protein
MTGQEVGQELFEMATEGAERKRSFIPKYFIICPLPVRSTGVHVQEYVRKYNQFRLRLLGANGVPGGKIARDMLMLFTSEAVYAKRHNTEGVVKLHYDSINRFVKSLGMARSNYNLKVLETMDKFAHCNIFFEQEKKRPFEKGQLDLTGMDEETAELLPKKGVMRLRRLVNVPFFSECSQIDVMGDGCKNGMSFAIDITLSHEFTRMAQESSVPIDFTAYCDMQSTLEKDLYVWLVYKNSQVIGQEGIFISRQNLLEQFGQDEERNEGVMYHRILEAVELIKKTYYQNLKYQIIKTGSRSGKGIVLYDSELVIKENDKRYVPLLSI